MVPVPETDVSLRRLVGTLGLPEAALAELRDKLLAVVELPKAGVSPRAVALLSDVLQGT